jgi:hypothetical protein
VVNQCDPLSQASCGGYGPEDLETHPGAPRHPSEEGKKAPAALVRREMSRKSPLALFGQGGNGQKSGRCMLSLAPMPSAGYQGRSALEPGALGFEL